MFPSLRCRLLDFELFKNIDYHNRFFFCQLFDHVSLNEYIIQRITFGEFKVIDYGLLSILRWFTFHKA